MRTTSCDSCSKDLQFAPTISETFYAMPKGFPGKFPPTNRRSAALVPNLIRSTILPQSATIRTGGHVEFTLCEWDSFISNSEQNLAEFQHYMTYVQASTSYASYCTHASRLHRLRKTRIRAKFMPTALQSPLGCLVLHDKCELQPAQAKQSGVMKLAAFI